MLAFLSMASVVGEPPDIISEYARSRNSRAADHADPTDVHRSSKATSSGDSDSKIPFEFTLVKSKRKCNDSSFTSSNGTVIPGPVLKPVLSMVLKPKDPATLIIKINLLKLHDEPESVSPYGLIRVRPNLHLSLLSSR